MQRSSSMIPIAKSCLRLIAPCLSGKLHPTGPLFYSIFGCVGKLGYGEESPYLIGCTLSISAATLHCTADGVRVHECTTRPPSRSPDSEGVRRRALSAFRCMTVCPPV